MDLIFAWAILLMVAYLVLTPAVEQFVSVITRESPVEP